MDEEIANEINNSKISAPLAKITDFKSLPVAAIFSKLATYAVFNRITKHESFINGIQAESLIGLQNSLREKLLKKQTDSFLTSEYFVKFHSADGSKATGDKD